MGLCDSDKCLNKNIRSIVSRVRGGASNWRRQKEGFRENMALIPNIIPTSILPITMH